MTTNRTSAARRGPPRLGRLRKAAEFRRVLQAGKIVSSRGRVIVRILRNELGVPRLGIIVGRKAMKRAVDRSRLRRLCREAFRHNTAGLPALDIVVQVRTQTSDGIAWGRLWDELHEQFAALSDAGRV